VEQLLDYENGPFSDREKAALRYADQMWLDHHDITDEHMDALRDHFDEGEIVEVSWAIGEFISLGKLVYVFGVPYGAGDPDGVADTPPLEPHTTQEHPR
jgi:hypothetical protein